MLVPELGLGITHRRGCQEGVLRERRDDLKRFCQNTSLIKEKRDKEGEENK